MWAKLFLGDLIIWTRFQTLEKKEKTWKGFGRVKCALSWLFILRRAGRELCTEAFPDLGNAMSKGVEPGQSLFNKHLIGDAYLFRDVTEEKEESLPLVRFSQI